MHHLIFEGAELAGKSWLMSQVYNFLEPKYNKNKKILDGCYWFNCDIGVYGTKHGKPIIQNYLKIFSELKEKNLLIEKFFLSDIVYNYLHNKKEVNYLKEEKFLKKLDFKIILITFPEKEEILKARIKDRLNLYPHYKRILQEPKWYITQQKKYKEFLTKISLPSLIVPTNKLPDHNLVNKILKWINEK